jgi:polyphenol oxidase
MLERARSGNFNYSSAPRLESEHGVKLLFSGRCGGVSSYPYSTMNLSYNVGDSTRNVSSNRLKVSRVIGFQPHRWVLCQQVHGVTSRRVDTLEIGRGGSDYWSALPRTDCLFTNVRRVVLGVLTADCVPIVLAVPGAVAVVHSGWRGTLAEAPRKALRRLLRLGGDASEVNVIIGPHLLSCCMQAGEEVAGMFRRRFGDVVVIKNGPRARIDMQQACISMLLEEGVEPSSIYGSDTCTACDDGFFSFRRSGGVTGRQAAMAVLL